MQNHIKIDTSNSGHECDVLQYLQAIDMLFQNSENTRIVYLNFQ